MGVSNSDGAVVFVSPVAEPEQVRTQVAIYGYPLGSSAPKLFDLFFPSMGLPRFRYIARETREVETETSPWRADIKHPDCLGTVITMPLKLAVLPYLDAITPEAEAIGCVNTTFFTSEGKHVGTNTDQIGIANAILTIVNGRATPFPADIPTTWEVGTGAGLMIGGGGAARAAVQAMRNLGLSPIFIVNRDPVETEALIRQFPSAELVAVETLEAARKIREGMRQQGQVFYAGVGAIPPFPAQTDAERTVYIIAAELLKQTQEGEFVDAGEGFCRPPIKPVFCEMPYKPKMTPMRQLAEDSGWYTVCGVEVALEGCFEQFHIWTGLTLPIEVREAGRRLLREA